MKKTGISSSFIICASNHDLHLNALLKNGFVPGCELGYIVVMDVLQYRLNEMQKYMRQEEQLERFKVEH